MRKFRRGDVKTPIEAWGQQHVTAMQPLAALLDQCYATQLYSQALERMMVRLHEVDETLSAHMIADTIRTWRYMGLWQLYGAATCTCL